MLLSISSLASSQGEKLNEHAENVKNKTKQKQTNKQTLNARTYCGK